MNSLRNVLSSCLLLASTASAAFAQSDPVDEEKWKNGLLPTGTYVGPNTKVNMFNGNITYGLSLVSLPGRAGHDVNITLSYNSKQLVHEDDGTGTIHCRWFNEAPHSGRWFLNIWPSLEIDGGNAYFTTPSGAVHHFIDLSTQYWETLDGTNLVYDSYNETVHMLDGSQFDFSDFQSSQKIYHYDRWGNYITYQFDQNEKLEKIIDTLGREVNFTLGIEDRVEEIRVKNHAGVDLVWTFAYEEYPFYPTVLEQGCNTPQSSLPFAA